MRVKTYPGEFELINRLKKFQSRSFRVLKGIGDDAAVLALDKKRHQLFTTDMLVEDVHFTRKMSPIAIGHKAMACNVSDIAAMGGAPTFAVVSIGIPRGLKAGYIDKIYDGMKACAGVFGAIIVGGDTVKADKLIINIALLGVVEKKNLVLRSGARPGDSIFVSGPLGGSLASGRHLWPVPRVKEARFLVEKFKPSSMIDISDGLAGDLGHILEESKVGAVIDEANVPLNKGARIENAWRDGEDFELLFTLSASKASKLRDYARRKSSFRFFEIGRIVSIPRKLFLRDALGQRCEIEPRGYVHF